MPADPSIKSNYRSEFKITAKRDEQWTPTHSAAISYNKAAQRPSVPHSTALSRRQSVLGFFLLLFCWAHWVIVSIAVAVFMGMGWDAQLSSFLIPDPQISNPEPQPPKPLLFSFTVIPYFRISLSLSFFLFVYVSIILAHFLSPRVSLASLSKSASLYLGLSFQLSPFLSFLICTCRQKFFYTHSSWPCHGKTGFLMISLNLSFLMTKCMFWKSQNAVF